MIKIITEHGELPVGVDFEIQMSKKSTFFSAEGEQSIPISIPYTPLAAKVLGNPLRLASNSLSEVKCVVRSGVYSKAGVLVISSISNSEITGSFLTDDSDLYFEYTDTSIKEIFRGLVRNDYSSIDDWCSYLLRVMRGEVSDDFNIFPCICTENDDIFYLNNYEFDEEGVASLIYKKRIITTSAGEEEVPSGYGVSPALYLHRFIDLLFEKMGYNVLENKFREEGLKRIVILNNSADTLCGGVINYIHLVPSCTLGEFITLLELKFNVSVRVVQKDVYVLCLDDCLDLVPDTDISDITEKNRSISKELARQISTNSDTSIAGASPAAETFEKFIEKYPVVTGLEEKYFGDGRGIHSVTYLDYNVVFRLATGVYYKMLKYISTGKVQPSVIGSNYFKRSRGQLEEEAFSAEDSIPAINNNGLFALGIGSRINNTTSIDDESNDTTQEVIFAIDGGFSAYTDIIIGNRPVIAPKYRYATTQSYNDKGEKLSFNLELTPEGLFSRFFSKYNDLYRSGIEKVTCKVDLSTQDILRYNMYASKVINGAKLLPIELNYTISDSVSVDSATYLLMRNTAIPENHPVFGKQVYKWELVSPAADAFVLEQEKTHDDVSYEFIQSDPDEEPIFIPAPLEAGLSDYHFKGLAHVVWKELRQGALIIVKEEDLEFDAYYISVLI